MLYVTNASGVVQTSASFIGNINPIRYRGYYYDTDLGLYYLQSRYYDPETGRFVNADGYVQTGTGIMDKNMFAYCLDDPVNLVDDTGCKSEWVLNGVEYCYDGSAGDFRRLERGLPPSSYEIAYQAYLQERTIVQKFSDSIAASLYLNVNLGTGFGYSTKIDGAKLNVGVKYKQLNITINKDGVFDGEKAEAYLNASFLLWSVGPHYTEEYLPSYKIEEGLYKENDTIPIFGKELYCIYGGGFEFGCNYQKFMEEWNRK